MDQRYDVIVLGAGAAGMFAAIEAGKRGRKVLVLDHARAPGEKIRISGGGRCNFTNIHASPGNYYCSNPHFVKSALARYTPRDFIALVERHGIAWHEKTLGQLFCDNSAKEIVDMLLKEVRDAGVTLNLGVEIISTSQAQGEFRVATSLGAFSCNSLVVATGGKSIPKMGATGLAYKIAENFGLEIIQPRPALVPFTLSPDMLSELAGLSGVAVDVEISCRKTTFREAMLFTHRGLSGPAILQISSVWREGDEVILRLLPELDWMDALKTAKSDNGRQSLATALAVHLPKRLAQYLAEKLGVSGNMADMSAKTLQQAADILSNWRIKPAGTEGYRTAEVTLGGIAVSQLDSKTMQAKSVSGLFFIGECVDVTGWLGGYNFQWAWASGFSAGQVA